MDDTFDVWIAWKPCYEYRTPEKAIIRNYCTLSITVVTKDEDDNTDCYIWPLAKS